jgi:hypothetical protein
VLGGCHRVLPESAFVEHGPRVYSGSYVNVKTILRHVGLRWDDVFQKTEFSPERIGTKRWYTALSVPEIASLVVDFCIMTFWNDLHGKDVSMKDYCTLHSFSPSSAAYVDLVCRFSDGAGADRYSLWEFLSGMDQHVPSFYVPRKPLSHVFEVWGKHLRDKGVDIYHETVLRVSKHAVYTTQRTIRAEKVVLCIPPYHADKLLRASRLREPGFREFAKKTKYEIYWSVTFFGVEIRGIPETDWGVIAMTYPFGVVSAAATLFNTPSKRTGKTLAQTREEDIPGEIARQLGFSPDTEFAYLSTSMNDQAFVAAARRGYVDPALACGVYSVGCHNGNSTYNFTSMESAVQNALVFLGRTPQSCITIGGIARSLVVLALVCVTINQQTFYTNP